MTAPGSGIPDLTIETLARGFCREAAGYGFTQMDYVKFVNVVLDQSMRSATNGTGARSTPPGQPVPSASVGDATRLPLRGARLVIRAFDPAADFALFDRWLSDTRGRHFLLSRMTAEQADIRELVRGERNVFGIITLPDSTPIGAVAFLDHDPAQQKAEMRKLIGEAEQRGKGLAKEASALWIRYGLTALGLKKIYVTTLHTNMRNVRLNEELGFRVEGILRNEVLIDGAYQDVLRMGLWSDDVGAAGPDGASPAAPEH